MMLQSELFSNVQSQNKRHRKVTTAQEEIKQMENNTVSCRLITKTVLHNFLVECYNVSKRWSQENAQHISEDYSTWETQMREQFGEQLFRLIPIMTDPVNAKHLPWIISSFKPENIAKMILLCPRYQKQIDDLIEAMVNETVASFVIENLLTELEEDAISVLLYAQN